MHEYSCVITRVVDGDTVDVDIDLGFDMWLKKQRIRLYGVDTPESRTSDKDEKPYGLLAKQKLKDKIDEAAEVKILTEKDEKGKFGRILGTISADGVNLNEWLVENKYAVRYHGQNKEEVQAAHLDNRIILNERGEIK